MPDPAETPADAFRREVRAFFAERVNPEMVERSYSTGTFHDQALYRALAERGWIGMSWPANDGRQGRSVQEMMAFAAEAHRARAPIMMLNVTMLVASTIRAVASEEQRRRLLPKVLSG